MPKLETWEEVHNKDMRKIEVDTAIKWAGRAVAAWSLYGSSGDLDYRDSAIEFASEAIEHAAQSGDDKVLGEVRFAIENARQEALTKRPQRFVGR